MVVLVYTIGNLKEGEFMTVGENVKHFRKEKGYTQEELGYMVGLSGVAIMRYEKEQREPKQDILIKIAKALGVQLRDLTDTSIWEEFDKQYPDMGENVARFEAVTAYLKEMGFSVDFAPEGEEGESYSAALGKDEHTAVFTQTEFEELQAGAKEAIEGRFYKKVLEQQKKK